MTGDGAITPSDDGWRPVLRALIETVLAFDHPAFPAVGVERVEQRLLEYFPIAGESGTALRSGLAAFDDAFAGQAGGGRFATAPLEARRAFLWHWARGETHAQQRFYASVKSMVLIAAYSLPELWGAIGHEGPR